MCADDYALLQRQAARRQNLSLYAGMLLQTIVRANIYTLSWMKTTKSETTIPPKHAPGTL
jgi:hypothetical protein